MTGAELIAAERQRQIDQEGWDEEHDKEHGRDILAIAGAVYALPARTRDQQVLSRSLRRALWPWDERWWKPASTDDAEGRLRELAKAGALIAAEMDRLIREAWQP